MIRRGLHVYSLYHELAPFPFRFRRAIRTPPPPFPPALYKKRLTGSPLHPRTPRQQPAELLVHDERDARPRDDPHGVRPEALVEAQQALGGVRAGDAVGYGGVGGYCWGLVLEGRMRGVSR